MRARTRRQGSVTAVVLFATVVGCNGGSGGDGGTTTPPPTSSISLALASSALSITQGQAGTITVNLTRTNFTSPINLTVEGAPAGVTATFNPSALPNGTNAATLTVNTTAAAAPGTSTLTVRATGLGVSDQTATVALTVTAAAAITVAVAPASISVVQGGSGTATVTISRVAGFTGNVDLTAEGLPTGVTASFNPASIGASATTSTLTLSATAAAPTGTSTITIRARGTGVTDKTATLSLQVTAQGPSGGTSITFKYCAAEVPLWFAYQSADGPWVRATSADATTFTINIAGRGAIATVIPTSDGGFETDITYGSTAVLQSIAASVTTCSPATSGSKRLTGTVAGLSGTDSATIVIGAAGARVGPAAPNFTLTNVPDAASDLVAIRARFNTNGTIIPSRFIVRRGVNLANNAALPTLDFGASESFAAATANLTINGSTSSEALELFGSFRTASGTALGTFINAAGTTVSYYGVPASQQTSGDRNSITLLALPINEVNTGILTQGRGGLLTVGDIVDRTVTLGPAPATATVSVAATVPYLRPRVQMGLQPEYNGEHVVFFTQSANSVVIDLTPEYLAALGSAATQWDATVPDFTGVAGFQTAWALSPRASTDWEVDAFAASDVRLGPAATDVMTPVAFRLGTIGASSASVASRSALPLDRMNALGAWPRRPTILWRLMNRR